MQLLWLDQFQFAGYYIAKEKGYYSDVGLDVELKKFKSKVDIVEEVTSQRATYGIGRSSLIIDKSNGVKIKLLEAIFQTSPIVFLATIDSGINKIEDIIGKQIMISKNNLLDVSIQAMLSRNNINTKDIMRVDNTHNIDSFINNKIDVMGAYKSNQPFILKEKGVKYNIFDPKDYGFDFYSDILFTTEQEILNNPNRVNNMTSASIKGWQYAFDNIEETVNLIFEKYNTQNKTKKALLYEANKLKKLAFHKLDQDRTIGHIDINKIEKIYDIYNLMGTIKNKINFDNLVYHHDKHHFDFTKEEREYLSTHQTITAHSETNWAPFNYVEDKISKGFSVDYIKLLATKLNINVKFISGYTWSEYIDMLQTKELDTIINIAHTKNRAKTINFTEPFYTIENIIYVNKNNPNYHTLSDLNGKTIATVKDFFTQQELERNRPLIKQIQVDDQLDALKLLALGKVDAVIAEKSIVDYIIKNNGISNILSTSFVDEEKYVAHLRIGTSKEDFILQNILNKTQRLITQSEISKLKEKWFGVQKVDKNNLTKKEKNYIKEKEVLKICTHQSWVPLEFVVDNKPQGISIDLLNIVKNNLGVEVEYISSNSWKQSVELFNNNKCDILPSVVPLKHNKINANTTNPYLVSNLAIVTKNDKPLVVNIDSILDKTMSKKKNSGLVNILESKYQDLNIVKTKNTHEAFLKVINDEVYFTIASLPLLSYYKNTFGFDDLQIAGYSKSKCKISMAVQKHNQILLDILNKELSKIPRSTHGVILDKWTQSKAEIRIDYDLIWKIVFIFAILTVIAILFLVILQRNNKRLNQFLNSTIEAVALFKNGKLIDANDVLLEIYGYESLSEIKGQSALFFVDKSQHKFAKQQLLESQEPYELNMIKKDGTVFVSLVKGTQLSKNMRVTIVLDMTELKNAYKKLEDLNQTLEQDVITEVKKNRDKDKQLLQQSRLAQMGEMISMIAHQWRQPLASISSLATALRIKTELDLIKKEKTMETLDQLITYTAHLSTTIDDFRNFFKPNKHKAEISCTDIVLSTLEIIGTSILNKNISIVKNLNSDKLILSYSNELKQVLLNLIKNAEDALIDNEVKNPTITIETKNNIIYISDNAGGIKDDIIERIFDPYFSTKLEKNGTGLGLYMSKTIIEEHCDGKLTVSNNGLGATFKIDLSDN